MDPTEILKRAEYIWISKQLGTPIYDLWFTSPDGQLLLEHIGGNPGEWSLEALSDEIGPLVVESIQIPKTQTLAELNAKSIARSKKPKDAIPIVIQRSDDDEKSEDSRPSSSAMAMNPTSVQHSNKPIEYNVYTARLHEHGNIKGIVPIYQKTPVSSLPQRWKCEVKFGDESAEAEAGSSKEARHIASYRICVKLGLPII